MVLKLTRANVIAAKHIIEHDVFNEIFTDMETSAINQAIAAPLTDDESRAAFLSEARAIRALRQKLRILIVQGEADSADEGAPD
jgi:hypothetical protein